MAGNRNNSKYPVSANPYRYGEDKLRVLVMSGYNREVRRFRGPDT